LSEIADTPEPPYYAVIFTSRRTEGDNGYASMADRMVELARQQPGFLGIESARQDLGITVSYWDSLDSIRNWKQNTEHLEAQNKGRGSWYSHYSVRISKVEKDYGFTSTDCSADRK
jgi:heme-degrading monooxygenase HmoA